MKKRSLPALLALFMLLTLVSCGGKAVSDAAYNTSGSTSMSMSKTEEAFDAVMEAPAEMGTGSANGSVLESQKIIYTGNLNLETTAFDDTVKALTGLAESLGGYLQSSTVGSGGRGYRWADYTIRVPSDKFQNFMEQAGALAHVTWQNTDLENITEAYYDTEGRLKTQQIKLERLQKLLSQAENMEDIITIESAISETEWNIENLSGTLRHYDALVDYATVNVNLQEVYKLSNTEEVPESFGDRLGSALSRGGAAFVDGMEDFIIFLAYNGPWLILWAAVIAAVVAFWRRLRHRKGPKKGGWFPLKRKKEQKPDDNQEQN